MTSMRARQPFSDSTNTFRDLVRERDPGGAAAQRRRSKVEREREARKAKEKGKANSDQGEIALDEKGRLADSDKSEEELWMAEATKVKKHIDDLATFLSSVRKAYLNLDSDRAAISAHQPPRSSLSDHGGGIDISGLEDDAKNPFSRWAKVNRLSDAERDEVDFQARVVVRRCVDRVKDLEKAEEVRRSRTRPPAAFSLFTTLLSSLANDASTSSSDLLSAHRSGITWYLNRRLADVSEAQKTLQEERIRRQREKKATLGGLGAGLTAGPSTIASGGGTAASATTRDQGGLPVPPAPLPPDAEDDSDSDDLASTLTPAQMQQFESENSALAKEMESTLASVQKAESALLEISSMQSELVHHLSTQQETAERLYDEAMQTTGRVDEGNLQLKKARERNKEARLWVLVFLVGASLALLFLHWYD